MYFIKNAALLKDQNMFRVATYLEKSGKNDFFSRSVNCQGILKNGQ